MFVEGAPLRCVVFIDGADPATQPLTDELRRRYPDGGLWTFSDQSEKSSVTVFAGGGR